ncbi:Hypothetical protein SRAE_1000318900 [Strongyloides ratti]|uniref:Uncharacterized protein n=1 Tax=Strongyloides ratti TaxID=34506 RepID=A0A090L553_STRRB|nr:Hypothetical protein SRAE_1000318900 [Strongyloides ratti]CEF64936.1 Hypothetical protein SRAE_1000318900 [Strongyloides ratti]
MLYFFFFFLFYLIPLVNVCSKASKNKDNGKITSATKVGTVTSGENKKQKDLPLKAGSVATTETGTALKSCKEKNANLEIKNNNNKQKALKKSLNPEGNKTNEAGVQDETNVDINDTPTKKGNNDTFNKIVNIPNNAFDGPATLKENVVASKFMI